MRLAPLFILAACGGALRPAEVARANRDAEFEWRGNGDWSLAGEEIIDVTDVAHFRRLLSDPRPKSLRINDWIYSEKEHAILCAPVERSEIHVTRLAVRLHHVDHPFAEATACLARLPIEYLAIDEFANTGEPGLDIGPLVAMPGLRALAVNGFDMKAFAPAPTSTLEDLRLFADSGGGDNVARHAFLEAATSLPRLRTLALGFDSHVFPWTFETLEPITRMPQLRALHLQIEVPPEALSQLLVALPRLTELRVPYTADDSVAATIAQTDTLRSLALGYNKMTDAGLALIARTRTLEELSLNGEHYTDAGIAQLGALTHLRSLKLSALDHVTGESFAALSRLVHLEKLELGAGPIDPQQFAHLANLRDLRVLLLGKTKQPLTCQQLGFLDGLTRLERLRLDDTVVHCLEHLKGMTKLATLELNRLDDALFATPPPRALTGDDIRVIRDLPLETLSLGDIDDSAALVLSRMPTLRRLYVISWSLHARGVIHLMRSPFLRVLGLGRGNDDTKSWQRWRAIQRARCGSRDLEVGYCPAPSRGVVCGTSSTGRSCDGARR